MRLGKWNDRKSEETCSNCGQIMRENLQEGDPVELINGELGWIIYRSSFGNNQYRIMIPGKLNDGNKYGQATFRLLEREEFIYLGVDY